MTAIICNYCDEVADYKIMGDFFTGDTVIGYCCIKHAIEGANESECHHLELRDIVDIIVDMKSLTK